MEARAGRQTGRDRPGPFRSWEGKQAFTECWAVRAWTWENDGKPLSREMLDYIYENKTSALIECAMMIGAVLAGASGEETGKNRTGSKPYRHCLPDPG